MSRKTKPVGEVLQRRDNSGYAVHNVRTNKVLDHTFTSRLDALAFASDLAALGTRAATRKINKQLAADAAPKKITSVMPDDDKPVAQPHFQAPPKRENADRDDVVAAFGEAAYWRAEITRIVNREAKERDPRKKMHLRLMLLNAQTQLELHS